MANLMIGDSPTRTRGGRIITYVIRVSIICSSGIVVFARTNRVISITRIATSLRRSVLISDG